MRRVFGVWAVAALMAIGGCAEPAKQAPPPLAPAAAPPPAPPPQTAAAPTPPPKPRDSCGAASLQYLVGKPHTDIPVPVNPAMRRVVCSSCMTTQDFVSTRQTITFDSLTGLVTSAKCG
ncbi:MAG: proteinase inhibitor i78 [Caulobacteraceae bacterium]